MEADSKALSERLAALSPAQRALFELRLKQREAKDQALTIPRRTQANYCALSLDQERLWFIHQLDPVSPAYNIYSAIRFKGQMDVAALTRSLNEIVRRHEIMRTSFATVDGQPVQVIAPHYSAHIPVVDLTHLPAMEREAEAERRVTASFQSPFDLQQLPLFRTTLIKLGEEDYVCPTVFHHIITDWISIHAFDREMALLYEAFRAGRPSPLPELPIQYADFTIWQRQWLNEQVLGGQLDYWRAHLKDVPYVLDLPTDRPRPAVQTGRGCRQPFVISKSHSAAARLLAQQEEVTSFIFFLAVFKLLLFRYTEQEQLIVGSPVANRNLTELQTLLGFFINQLVFCSDLSGDPTFRELLHRVRTVALGAFAHQDVPFGVLVDELQPERDLSRTPLTQVVLLVLKNEPEGAVKFAGVELAPFIVDGQSSKFDMTMSLWDREAGFGGWIEYNTDLFDAATVIRLTEHFRTLLAGIVANPDRRLSELPLLTETERHQMLLEWNDTAREWPAQSCVHELFAAQAARTPRAPALVMSGRQLSYDELNRQVNRLAHYLRARGVGQEVLVGILLDRSPTMIVAMLAVLKARGAFVPLDPEHPAERLAFMVEDAALAVLITEAHLLAKLPSSTAAVVCLDTEQAAIAQSEQQNPPGDARPDNLAYVIYTSGSTGKPKGVLVEHRNLVNTLSGTQEKFDFNADDVIACLAPFSFDISLFEWLSPLLVGGSCLLLDSHEVLDPAVLAHTLATVTVFHAVPGLMRQITDLLLAEGTSVDLYDQLRHVFMGGEAVTADLVQQAQRVFPSAEVAVLYGPTEATIMCTGYKAGRGEQVRHQMLGRPFGNMTLRLCDRQQQPVPVGVVGEIYIGGASVTRGYLKRAELTAAKYVSIEGERYYRSGDLGRYLPDGNVVFVGRRDEQVKVRGYRIEPGEIEAVLGTHPAVREAVVLVREDVPGNQRLVAFVVPVEQQEVRGDELRSYLADKLPEYMIPTAYVLLSEIPLTPNRKADRRKLLSLRSTGDESAASFVPPRTPAEETLAEIWRQVLGLEQVGVHHNFFALGGDSILSIQIVARANRAGLTLLPKHIFQHQTIAELALIAGTTANVAAEQGVVTGTLPLTPIQLSFFEQELSEPHHFNQAVLLAVQPGLDATAWTSLTEHLLSHHDALRLRFARGAAGWEQHHAMPSGEVPFTRHDLSRFTSEEQRRAVEAGAAELQASLQLQDGPLVRVAYFDLGDAQPHRLLIVAHHLVIDGISWRILLDDLQTAHRQLSRGEAVSLPPKTTAFKHWAERLAEYAHTDEVAREAEYWTAEQRSMAVALPVDYVGGANTVASAATVETALGHEETRALLQRVPPVYRTQINDLLLTALLQTFNRWTGDARLLVDVEGHGREELFDELDLSRTVGWFTTLYPLLLDLAGTQTVGATLKTVKEQLRAVPRGGIGYGLLRYLGDADTVSKLRALPQAEVVFNYLGQLDRALPEASIFQPASESAGPLRSAQADRRHLLEIDGSVVGGRLRLTWTYSANVHRSATVERLADEFITALKAIIAHCGSAEAGGYTPSDFPLARLAQTELDRLVNTYPHVEDVYVLSPVQQGMLFHTLAAAEPGAYTEQVCVELRGEFAAEAFAHAWQQVIDRHTSLRTSFVWRELARPLQVVHQSLRVGVAEHDWRDVPATEQQQQLEVFLGRDRRLGFDLSQPPLMRLTLIRLSRDRYYFIWTHHHIILDGWSLPLVVREVLQHYEALRAGGQPRTAASRPYRNYIHWLERRDQAQAESYWRQLLRGFTEPLPLGTNGTAHGFARHEEYGDERVELSPQLTADLQAFTREHQLTLNTLVQAAWALLLHLYSGRDDVLFGMTVSGRPAEIEEIETMVGLFINTLPVRVQVARQTPLLAWLQQHQSRQVELRQYEHCALVQEWSEVPLGQPLFETLLVYENYPSDGALQAQGMSLEIRALKALVRTKYPLTLVVAPGAALSFYIAYDRRRFAPDTVQTMLADLGALLETIIGAPSQLVATVLDAIPPPHIEPSRPAPLARAQTDGAANKTFVAPQTPLEEMLAGIWADVLGVSEVSVEDNFFDMGGHSLLATQVVSRVRATFQIELPLQHVFESPTVAGMARHLGAAMQADPAIPSPPLERLPRDEDLPLSLAQEPLWELDQVLPGTALFNIPLAVRLQGLLNVAALEQSLREIVRRHEVLRTTFSTSAGRPVQVITPESSFNLPLTDLQTSPAAEREAEALHLSVADALRPFNLTAGPLLRIRLLRLSEQEHWLLFTMHHIIADAWAAGVFVRELTVLYDAFARAQPSPLPELAIQYADFAAWQRECLRQGSFSAQLDYWKEQLGGHLAPLHLRTDHPRTETPTLKTASQTLSLTKELTAALKSFSRAEGVSLFMLLLTAYQILLCRYAQQADVRVGTLIANRNRSEIENIFGLFVNTLVMRADLAGDPTCRAALQRVRRVVLDAFNNQDLPFEQLLQVLESERGLERTALIEVLFILQNAPVGALALPGLTVSHIKEVSELADPGVTLTMFDLILMMGEGPEGLTASLKYKTELFDEPTIDQLLHDFQYVLESIVSQPERRLSALELGLAKA